MITVASGIYLLDYLYFFTLFRAYFEENSIIKFFLRGNLWLNLITKIKQQLKDICASSKLLLYFYLFFVLRY